MMSRSFRCLICLILWPAVAFAVPVAAPPGATVEVVLQSGHQLGVVAIAFSPDGALAASIARESNGEPGTPGEFKLWNARTGELIRILSGVSPAINSVAFSPDGTRLATAEAQNAITLWNVKSGQIQKKLWAPGPVAHLVWKRDVGLIGAEGLVSGVTGKIFIWNEALSQIRYYLPSGDGKPYGKERFESAISPLQIDKAGAVLSIKTANAITVWDVKKRARLARIALAGDDTSSAFFAPTLARDGSMIAMTIREQATIWNTKGGQKIASWTPGFRKTLEFAPDGKTLFCRDFGNGSIERRQTLTGKLIGSVAFLGEEQGGIGAFAFSPDGLTQAAAGDFNPAIIWRRAGQMFGDVEPLNALTSLFFQPQSDIMGWSQDNGAFYFWNWKTGQLSHFFALKEQESFRNLSAEFSRDGAHLFVAVETELRCLDARSGALRWKTPSLGNYAQVHLAVAPDGQTIATTATDNPLRFWNAKTGSEILLRDAPADSKTAPQQNEAHGALTYSADGKLLAVGGDSNAKAALFDVENRRFVRSFDTYNGASVQFSPDSKILVISNSYIPAIEVFDVATGAQLWKRNSVLGAAFEGDETLVLRTDKEFVLASALTGQQRNSVPELATKIKPELSDDIPSVWLMTTPDRRFWVGKGGDEILRMWDAKTGKSVLSLVNPALPDRASPHWLAFTPDGHYIGSPGIEKFFAHRSGSRVLTPEQSRQLFRPDNLLTESQ